MPTEKKCRHPGCEKPVWGTGMLSKEKVCSGHYQRERRLIAKAKEEGRPISDEEINLLLGTVRHYGEGSNHVSTRVTTEMLGWLNAKALKHYPVPGEDGRMVGDVSALLRHILGLYKEGDSADPGESIVQVEEGQDYGVSDEHPMAAQG